MNVESESIGPEESQRRLEWVGIAFGVDVSSKLSELLESHKKEHGGISEDSFDQLMGDALKAVYKEEYEAGKLSGLTPFSSD